MHHLLDGYEAKVIAINDVLKRARIDKNELAMLDHLGYRTQSIDEYNAVLNEFRMLGNDMGEVLVQGRPITIIALHDPLVAGGWTIPFIEVIAPKGGSPYPSGLEHAEFVTLRLLGEFENAHPDLDFKRDAMDRKINPELKYHDGDVSIKFHRLSVGSVVEIEAALATQGV